MHIGVVAVVVQPLISRRVAIFTLMESMTGEEFATESLMPPVHTLSCQMIVDNDSAVRRVTAAE
jgi:hypothetical protein